MTRHDPVSSVLQTINKRVILLSTIILIINFVLIIDSNNVNNNCQAFIMTNRNNNMKGIKTTPLELTSISKKSHHLPQQEQQQNLKKSSTILYNTKDNKSNNNDIIQKTTPYLTVMLPLLLVYISNQWSRSSIYYLVNFSSEATATTAINIDLHFSETEYGLLASIGFTALYAFASLFAGTISDSYNRKTITYLSCTAWTIATICTAIATSYNDVLLSRIFMGLSCAFTTPAAYTIIRDTFPKNQAAFASSIFSSAIYVAGSLSSLTILLDQNFGWRGSLYIIAMFGTGAVLASALVLPNDVGLPNSSKEEEEDKAITTIANMNNPISGASRIISNPILPYLFLASFLRFSSGLTIGIWSAAYFRLSFPDSTSEYAITNALIVGLCGVTSNLVGGYLADKFATIATSKYNQPENAGRIIVPILSSLLAVPTWFLCIQFSSSSFEFAMIWLAIEYIVAECWVGPVIAILQSTVDKTYGGTAQGLFTLVGALANLAPALLGFLYQQQQQQNAVGSTNSAVLGNLLSVGVCTCYFLSFLVFIGCFFKIMESNADDGTTSVSPLITKKS